MRWHFNPAIPWYFCLFLLTCMSLQSFSFFIWWPILAEATNTDSHTLFRDKLLLSLTVNLMLEEGPYLNQLGKGVKSPFGRLWSLCWFQLNSSCTWQSIIYMLDKYQNPFKCYRILLVPLLEEIVSSFPSTWTLGKHLTTSWTCAHWRSSHGPIFGTH